MSSRSRYAPGRRILVVAEAMADADALRAEIVRRARRPKAEVFVVCPALDTRRARWLSDGDDVLANVSKDLVTSLAALEELGIAAHGHVGDADLGRALNDAVRAFDPTEIVVVTVPGGSTALERLVGAVRERSGVQVTLVEGLGRQGEDGP